MTFDKRILFEEEEEEEEGQGDEGKGSESQTFTVGEKTYTQDELNDLVKLKETVSDIEEFNAKIPLILDMNNFYHWEVLSKLAGNFHQDFAHQLK